MKRLYLSLLLTTFVIAFASFSFAQEKEKEIKVGSHVLTQTGDDPFCCNNGPYTYEKVMDIPGVDKKELYSRVKKWMIATMKLTKESIFFDDADNNSISATSIIAIDDFAPMYSQTIEFKLVVSFKDNKIKVEAGSFLYRGSERAIPWQKKFNDLKPLREVDMQKVYNEFDEKFVIFRKAMLAAAKNASSNDW